jgi:hypothetical protein
MKGLSRNHHSQKEEETMSFQPTEKNRHLGFGVTTLFIAAVMLVSILGSSGFCAAAAKQKAFTSPEEAVTALVGALKAGDGRQLAVLLGPEGKAILSSGDAVRDKAERESFLGLYAEKHGLEEKSVKKVVLAIGNDDWPFPIPIVKAGKVWRFDTKEGKKEILARRIGKNELSVMKVLLAFVDAQREYALKDWDGDGILEYAERIASEPGTKNGLYWDAKEGEEVSPLGTYAAAAHREGYPEKKKSGGKAQPFYGYFFKTLKTQGKDAAGGAYQYMVNGNLMGGFAYVAYPATYGNSGVMTFIVNHDGVVYEKNLGKGTAKAAGGMKAFNPDRSWKKVDSAP